VRRKKFRWEDVQTEQGDIRTTYTFDLPEGIETQRWGQIGWIAGDGSVFALGELPDTLVSGAEPLWVMIYSDRVEGSQEVA
jgi:hypothetical protein